MKGRERGGGDSEYCAELYQSASARAAFVYGLLNTIQLYRKVQSFSVVNHFY
jgi:hypothetical protein